MFLRNFPRMVIIMNAPNNFFETTCSICGGEKFTAQKVIGPELATQWQLSEDEVSYVDRQQGYACEACGANLRVVALGEAVRRAWGTNLPLQAFVATPDAAKFRVLDIMGQRRYPLLQRHFRFTSAATSPMSTCVRCPLLKNSFDLVLHSGHTRAR